MDDQPIQVPGRPGLVPGLSRRTFLRRAAATGAFAAMPAVLAACGDDADTAAGGGDATEATTSEAATSEAASTASETAATGGSGGGSGEPLRIGLLVPQSGVYASLGEDMREGLELYLDRNDNQMAGRPVELILAETEANPEVGLNAARRLVEQDQVAAVIGIVSSAVALGVRDLFDEAQVPLIVSNAGANDITRAGFSPFVFRTSFTNYQPTFAIGRYAYDNVAQEGFVALASDYAAGREQVEGFVLGFQDAGGSAQVTEIYPPFQTTSDYQPFLQQIRDANAQAVFAFFSGSEAIRFVQQYNEFGLKGEIPLVGSGFLTDEGVLGEQGDAASGVRTALHWSPALDNETNVAFLTDYREAFGSAPTVFSVQTYDAAQLLASALEAVDGDTSDPQALVDAMEGVGEIDSPRGMFSLDDNHNPIQNQYLREVQEVDGELANAVLEDLGPVEDPGPDA